MRPVRPMRCTCCSMFFATSKFTTVVIPDISSPLAATSVATKTCLLPFRNAVRLVYRLPWSKSPCMKSMRDATSGSINFLRFKANSSHPDFELTKTSTLPVFKNPGSWFLSHDHFSLLPTRTTTSCVTSSLDCPSFPTVTRIGSLRIAFASPWMRRLRVAEKRRVCLSGRIWSMMDLIWYSNPISNIRSASSSTTMVQRRRLVAFFLRSSMSLPGVATTTSAPLFKAEAISHFPAPPNTATTFAPKGFMKRCASW
mmetsp:Transcript_12144/g.16025  ORF Transcript_12144/g.16025 Transcript_12144/m.16025 type:complete len:255 (-) Transcript_12144:208-972(-)